MAALGGCACPASGPWGPQTAGNQPRPSATQLTDASSTIDSRHPPSNDELVVRGQSPGYPQAAIHGLSTRGLSTRHLSTRDCALRNCALRHVARRVLPLAAARLRRSATDDDLRPGVGYAPGGYAALPPAAAGWLSGRSLFRPRTRRATAQLCVSAPVGRPRRRLAAAASRFDGGHFRRHFARHARLPGLSAAAEACRPKFRLLRRRSMCSSKRHAPGNSCLA